MTLLTLHDIASMEIEPTSDLTLTPYSHSMLNAIATCPTQGLVTYVANRIPAKGGRAMALEAGRAAHEAYAAARLWQLHMRQLNEHVAFHGRRLFGDDRLDQMLEASEEAGSDQRNAMLRFCLEAFYSCGFYDDPADKRRTYTNIEEALIAYLDRVDFRRNVWVQDKNDPTSMVGIELPIDMTVSYKLHEDYSKKVRFIGTADGVTLHNGEYRLEENKTASRLGEAWSMSFWTSHQITGYLLGLSTCYGIPVHRAAVHGMSIPLPRSYDAGGLMTEVVSRNSQQMQDFLMWVLHQTQVIETHAREPYNAPKNTGACNKWYRACMFIPLCASEGEERVQMFDEMVARDLTPTEKAMEDDNN